MDLGKLQTDQEWFGAIECILFVSGEPVDLVSLQRALGLTELELQSILGKMEESYAAQDRGVQLYRTGDTVQLVSNRKYAGFVEALLQPAQTKSFSQAMLETLSVVAYKQPVTRNDIEAIRGVRCEYSVSQLLKLGLIQELGRKDAVGRFCGSLASTIWESCPAMRPSPKIFRTKWRIWPYKPPPFLKKIQTNWRWNCQIPFCDFVLPINQPIGWT